MKLNYYTFLKKLFLYTVVLVALGVLIIYFLPPNYISPTIPYLYVFFFSVTMLVHYILLQVSIKKAANFINYFMLLTFGKLIFFLSVVLAYALINRDDLVQFVVAFFALYIFYTVFEIVQSLNVTKELKNRNKPDQEESS